MARMKDDFGFEANNQFAPRGPTVPISAFHSKPTATILKSEKVVRTKIADSHFVNLNHAVKNLRHNQNLGSKYAIAYIILRIIHFVSQRWILIKIKGCLPKCFLRKRTGSIECRATTKEVLSKISRFARQQSPKAGTKPRFVKKRNASLNVKTTSPRKKISL